MWPTLGPGHEVLLVPVGSLEQHGPHLPLGTDTIVATAASRALAGVLERRGVPVTVAPALAYGASGEHEHFPGTVSVGHDALGQTVLELVRSASRWAAEVVLVNGHGGNAPTLERVVGRLRDEGRRVRWLPAAPPPAAGADAHAGRTETSLLLFLDPHLVRRPDAVAGATAPIATLMPRLRSEGVRAVSPNGVLGDPRGSSAEEGRVLFEGLVRTLVTAMRDVLPRPRAEAPDAPHAPVAQDAVGAGPGRDGGDARSG